jgi:hypothetical protein
MPDAALDDVEGAVVHHLQGSAWILGAPGDAERGHVEAVVDPPELAIEERTIPDVALDQAGAAGLEGPLHVAPGSAEHVVEQQHLAHALAIEEEVGDV